MKLSELRCLHALVNHCVRQSKYQQAKLARGAKPREHAMSAKANSVIAVIGIDIGKNSFHVVGQDKRGAIILRQKWSRG
jgi:transposase